MKVLQSVKLNQLDGLMAFCKAAEHCGFTAAAAELESRHPHSARPFGSWKPVWGAALESDDAK
jgi:hypothetical protein